MDKDQPDSRRQNGCILLAGPTASGKSALAIAIAEEFDGVIINADSMQVYDGLCVVTARPSAEEVASAPHRLYGVLDPADYCNAARWRDMALVEIEAARSAGKLPILVGGTGLYFDILTKGIAEVPDISDEVRGRLRELHKREGNAVIHARLREKDPKMAEKLNEGDSQRLLRALEVVEETGVPLGEWQKRAPTGDILEGPRLWLALTPDRDWLYERCDRRFDWMIDEGGALEEVAEFLKRDLDPALPAMKALGLPELAAVLVGKMTESAARERAKMLTRRYAKRQMTWVRNKMCEANRSSAQDLESLKGEFFPFIRRFLLTEAK
ncbi:MAG: tRNA (adenosine(37)-N6)-dimethylallyltransferase MiaA [Sneathiella sp.]|uniref:tRNA (adenosine(37)-N6)-dimethylallyltransferase MiaA n=1 Tax=Sneathiella sp. TaxID=1964365 RepID=UPI000C3637FA|nr:tRNA (adenosine(37)-N6)-dimethylallyltransferase MiaA [Sneathiella sp.]MAZ04650.1 tRNA (adenosine(37)-N6)-dimethylallyltransferase MiaA [Sneathiella sp.]